MSASRCRHESRIWAARSVSPTSTYLDAVTRVIGGAVGRVLLPFVGVLESWGLRVDVGRHVLDEWGYMAGWDEDRLADLNDAFRDPTVRGSNRSAAVTWGSDSRTPRRTA